MEVIPKYEEEEIPLAFDFTVRLGALAPGARIVEVLALTVAPTGHVDDLEVGTVGNASIDVASELAVQVRAVKGRASVGIYRPRCKALIAHAGATYPLIVELVVRVIA